MVFAPNRCCTGTLKPRAIGDLLPEYAIPRFVGFANNDTELLVGYLEQAIVYVAAVLPVPMCSKPDITHWLYRKRYSIDPWQLLERKTLNQSDELEAASEGTQNRKSYFM